MARLKSLRWWSVLALGLLLGGGGGVGAHVLLPESPFVRGLYLGERRLPEGVSAATWLAEREDWWTERTIVLRWDDGDAYVERSLRQLGIGVDYEATLARAREIGHRGSLGRRLHESREARRGSIDLPVVWRTSGPRLDDALAALSERVRREPIDARLDVAEKVRTADVPGRELDVEAAKAAILALDLTAPGLVVVELPTRPVSAKVTLEQLADVDVTKVVATFETRFSPHVVGRAANVRRAADLIDGRVIAPGALFSFNETVGPRTLERGFSLAPEIQGDELTTGVGGGTCQVSSTLFAAAVFGALEIVERKSHSQVSSYAKMGLDATVSYPTTDLKLKNPLPYAVMIHTSFPSTGVLRVELLGGEPPAQVSYAYGVGEVEDFVRRITVKPDLPPGKRVRRQKGSRGYSVTSIVTLKYRDGRIDQKTYYSGYRPAPEVFWVAPGYDEAELPPLPKHALGVEGRLADGSLYDSLDDARYGPTSL